MDLSNTDSDRQQPTGRHDDVQQHRGSASRESNSGDDTHAVIQKLEEAEKMADQLESKLDTLLNDLESLLFTLEPAKTTNVLDNLATESIAGKKT